MYSMEVNTAASIICSSCETVRDRGITLVRGPWYVWEGGRITASDAIGAFILAQGRLPVRDRRDLEALARPGLVAIACELLDVSPRWLHDFWLGWDRNYQITITSTVKGREERTFNDDVSALGIELARLFVG